MDCSGCGKPCDVTGTLVVVWRVEAKEDEELDRVDKPLCHRCADRFAGDAADQALCGILDEEDERAKS